MNKQQQQQADSAYCCFHPRELVVGVCARCLNDRLHLLLASTSTTNNANAADQHLRRGGGRGSGRTTTSISLPKVVLALGSSFLQRLDSRHHHRTTDHHAYSDSDDGNTSAASLDDSFISIKFEDNGKATWDSSKVVATIKAGAAPVRSSSTALVVEHAKRGGVGVTRWRKQVVGRLLQLARWKRSVAKAAGGGAASNIGLDGKKVPERSKARGRAGWIRSLTRRRAAAAHGDRAWS